MHQVIVRLTIICVLVKMILEAGLDKLIKIVNFKALAERFKTLYMRDNSKIIFIMDGVDTFVAMVFIGDFLIMDYVMDSVNSFQVKEKQKKEIGIWVY